MHKTPHYERCNRDEDDVEWQHVEVDRLVLQRQRLADQHVWMREEVGDVELVLVHWIIKSPRGTGNLRRKDEEENEMSDIHLPDPQPQPLQHWHKLARRDDRNIDEAEQVT